MTRNRDYPIIRFLVGTLYAASVLTLFGGLAMGGYLWMRAEALSEGVMPGGPFAGTLGAFDPSELCLGAAVAAGGSLIAFLLLGALAQMLSMLRHRAIDSALQVQLLEDILELNEEVAKSSRPSKVELCDGCGRLGALHHIDSGQWVCRECRRQLRTA